MNYTQSIGNLTELKCISKFIELGYECSIPYGNGAKYDFIADIDGKLLRIQCKTCSNPKKNGIIDYDAICITTVSQTTNTKKTTRHTYDETQIDYFATFYKDKVYIIPVNECSTTKTLRFAPPKNGQKYNKAEDYEIEKFISYSSELVETKNLFLTIKNKKQQTTLCSICGTEIIKNTTGLCKNCFNQQNRKCERPSREELKNMIRTTPFLQIAKQFGVTDNTIRKWCDAVQLPRRVSQIKQYSDQEWKQI